MVHPLSDPVLHVLWDDGLSVADGVDRDDPAPLRQVWQVQPPVRCSRHPCPRTMEEQDRGSGTHFVVVGVLARRGLHPQVVKPEELVRLVIETCRHSCFSPFAAAMSKAMSINMSSWPPTRLRLPASTRMSLPSKFSASPIRSA